MKGFRNNQRVIVTKPVIQRQALLGKKGTVVRLLMRSAEGWVKMDDEIGPLAVFPSGDSRHNHVCLWPEECKVAP